MSIRDVSSLTNETVKAVRALHMRKARNETGLFLAEGLSADPLPMDADEEIAGEARPLAELVAMALDGRLDDAKSVVALLRAARHLAL